VAVAACGTTSSDTDQALLSRTPADLADPPTTLTTSTFEPPADETEPVPDAPELPADPTPEQRVETAVLTTVPLPYRFESELGVTNDESLVEDEYLLEALDDSRQLLEALDISGMASTTDQSFLVQAGAGDVRLRVVGDTAYATASTLNDGRWLSMPAATGLALLTVPGFPVADLMAEALWGTSYELGTPDEVDEVPVTVVVVDVPDAVQPELSTAPPTLDTPQPLAPARRLLVAIDVHNQIRRIEATFTTGVTVSTELYDFNSTSIEVHTPEDHEPVDESSFQELLYGPAPPLVA
jgi:hypothetical protein